MEPPINLEVDLSSATQEMMTKVSSWPQITWEIHSSNQVINRTKKSTNTMTDLIPKSIKKPRNPPNSTLNNPKLKEIRKSQSRWKSKEPKNTAATKLEHSTPPWSNRLRKTSSYSIKKSKTKRIKSAKESSRKKPPADLALSPPILQPPLSSSTSLSS